MTDVNLSDSSVFRVWSAAGKHKAFGNTPDDGSKSMEYYGTLCVDRKTGNFDGTLAMILAPGKIRSDDGKIVDAVIPTAPVVKAVKVKATEPEPEVIEDIVIRTEDGTISEKALARINADEIHLASHGIVLPPPVYAPGTKVIGLGRENFRIERAKIESLPAIEDSLMSIIRTVRAENRHDIVVKSNDVFMRDDGTLRINNEVVYWEPYGFESFIAHHREVFPRGKEMMLCMDPDQRAAVFNRHVNRLKASSVRIRMRNVNGKNTVYATTSDSYTPVNLDHFVSNVLLALQGSNMRGEVVYDPNMTRLKVNAWLPMDAGDPDASDLAAGDIFKAGLTIRSSDSGVGGMRVDASFIRNLCLNLIILGEGKKDLLNQRHRGDKSNIGADIHAAIRVAEDMFKPFRERWRCLRETPMDALFKGNDIREIVKEVAPSLDLPFKPEVVEAILVDNYAHEPGDSLADLMNAITRMHTSPLISEDKRELVEVRAGRLLDTWSSKVGLKAMPLGK